MSSIRWEINAKIYLCTKFEVSCYTRSKFTKGVLKFTYLVPGSPSQLLFGVFCHGTCQDLSVSFQLHRFQIYERGSKSKIYKFCLCPAFWGYSVNREMGHSMIYLCTKVEVSSYIHFEFTKGVPKFTNWPLDSPPHPFWGILSSMVMQRSICVPNLKFLASPETKITYTLIRC